MSSVLLQHQPFELTTYTYFWFRSVTAAADNRGQYEINRTARRQLTVLLVLLPFCFQRRRVRTRLEHAVQWRNKQFPWNGKSEAKEREAISL